MQLERGAQIVPAMLADMNALDLTAMHAVQQTAGLLGALRRVLRQIARPAPPLLVIPGEPLNVELPTPAHAARAELVRRPHAHRRGGAAQRVLEHLHRESPVRRTDLAAAVRGHPAIQTDQRMHMHQAAPLVLGNPDVRHSHQLVQALLRHPRQRCEPTRQVDRRAPPQLAKQVVPHHRALVVKARRAQRLPQARIIRRVPHRARQRHPMPADRRIAQRTAAPRPTIGVKQPSSTDSA
jgi:hypothetical protein